MINVLLRNRENVKLHLLFFHENGDRLLSPKLLISNRNPLLRKEQDQYYREEILVLFQLLLNACYFGHILFPIGFTLCQNILSDHLLFDIQYQAEYLPSYWVEFPFILLLPRVVNMIITQFVCDRPIVLPMLN